jgi:hypothetical protein
VRITPESIAAAPTIAYKPWITQLGRKRREHRRSCN